jgi:hypothetical protein
LSIQWTIGQSAIVNQSGNLAIEQFANAAKNRNGDPNPGPVGEKRSRRRPPAAALFVRKVSSFFQSGHPALSV